MDGGVGEKATASKEIHRQPLNPMMSDKIPFLISFIYLTVYLIFYVK